jgi:cytochrome c
MNNLIKKFLLVFLVCLTPVLAATATPDEAKALVHQAVKFYKAHGKDKAFEEINRPNGKFQRGELYIFVLDGSGSLVAQGGGHELSPEIGKKALKTPDANGKFFNEEIMKVGKEGGWVDYVYTNPKTGKLQPKSSYIIQADNFRFGCGYYK